jgi:hypothetical protein
LKNKQVPGDFLMVEWIWDNCAGMLRLALQKIADD